MREDTCCVYCIENKINNKKYIGSTINFRRRINIHLHFLRNGKHCSKHLQSAWNKYGEDSFNIFMIEIIEDKANIILREQYWIDFYESHNDKNGYNINKIAYSCLGVKRSEETKLKLSKLKIGFKASEETKKKLSDLSKGENNSFYNKKHTDESKQKMREAHMGKVLTESQLNALSLGRGSTYFTEETYKKISEKNRGEGSGSSKLSESDVIEILKMIKNKCKYKEISEKYKISVAQISRIRSGIRWGYLKEERGDLYE